MAIKRKGLLIDITRCIGCNACSENCKEVNDLPPKIDDRLAQDTWTMVEDKGEGRYVRQLCRHCEDPACVSVCPVAAIRKTENGPVIYKKDVCLGCRYCMMACPFGVPTFEWHSYNPRIRKCTLCATRIEEGQSTGCTDACPTEATVFGNRDELISIAKARIAAEPKKYQPYIFGENEVGGTSVMFLSAIPFEELGFRTYLESEPLPERTWQVLKHVPNIVVLGIGFLGGTYWLFRRREKVATHEAHVKEEKVETKGGEK
jgi:formate dehydrogenase iron-sulfur subunit